MPIRLSGAKFAKLGIPARSGPEPVPLELRFIKRNARLISGVETSEPRTHIHMCAAAQFLQFVLNSRILPQSLNETADCIKRRHPHLLFQLLIMPRREAALDPLFIIRKLEIGRA